MKKILTYILITIFLITGALAPLGIKKTEALTSSKKSASAKVKTFDANIKNGVVFNTTSKKQATSQAESFDLNVKKQEAFSEASFDPAKKLRETVWCAKAIFNINIGGCFAIIGYNTYVLSANVVGLSSSLFDTLLAFSLDTKIINQDFIQNSWQSMRDFVNMLFILILVVISISIILDVGSFASTTLIRNVIIVALLVNFSLFATKVVIDVGNITAKGFYDAINIKVSSNNKDSIIQNSNIEKKSISGALLSGFNPARMISPESFKAWRKNYVDKTGGTQTANFALVFIFSIATGLNLYLAYILFMISWLFVTRIVWLWILMILSPLAFVSFAIPGFSAQGKKWWNKLVDNSFGIVVFMFLIWLTLRIITSNFMKSAFSVGPDPSLIKLITIIVMQGIIVFVLLKTALEKTKEMISDGGLGDKAMGVLKTGAMAAGVVATGGASLLLRQGVGGWAQRKAERDQKAGKGTTRMGALKLKTLRSISRTKFGAKDGYKQRTERVAREHLKYQETLSETAKDKNGRVFNPQEEYATNVGKRSVVENVLAYAGMKVAGEEKFTTQYKKLIDAQKELAVANGEVDRIEKSGVSLDKIKEQLIIQRRVISEKQSRVNKIKEKINGLKKAAEPKKEDKKKKKKKK